MRFIIVQGDPVAGFSFTGPFDEPVDDWSEFERGNASDLDDQWWVAELHAPAYPNLTPIDLVIEIVDGQPSNILGIPFPWTTTIVNWDRIGSDRADDEATVMEVLRSDIPNANRWEILRLINEAWDDGTWSVKS